MTVAVAVVHDIALVVLEVTDELLQFGQQPGLLGTVIRGDLPPQAFKPLQCRIGAAVPEVSFCTAKSSWAWRTVSPPSDRKVTG